ncbi:MULTISPECIES: fimbrial protein [unclassified Providencia]|uniref:fimbrial protein n=1 Tax=unclassified Providencia TaxID=2633465 RepID=UPI0012B5E90A|nr:MULTISPECIES: fimbrial protein [unclassified Providencia]MTB38709.1 fimbrial protein [Providencia sp. wls1949]MTC08050.1 fimbrial protein [Providencia sp. wls1948]
MSINTILRHGIALTAVLSSISAYATCTRDSRVPAENIDMQFGRVIVSPDLPVGSVIQEKTWPMKETGSYWAVCYGGTVLDAIVTAKGVTEGPNKVYNTNIPGIGLRFQRMGAVAMTYPDTYKVKGESKKKINVYLAGSTFKLQIIKTAENTGSGRITQGEYTRYGYKPNSVEPAIITYLSADAITIVFPSCKITTGANQDVHLDTVRRTEFRGRGTTAGEKQFPINLLCNGGVSISPDSVSVNMNFYGTLARNTTAKDGVLANTAKSSSAQGIGVQVLTDKREKLHWGETYKVGELATARDKAINMNYIARYYQHEDKISAGEVQAKMQFNITYD